MADPIKPGHFVAKPEGEPAFDYAGFTGSMAARIEAELNDLLVLDGLPPLPDDEEKQEVRDLRRLFVAIARGVTIHLRERNEALTVRLPLLGDPLIPVEIDTDEGP